MRFLLRSLLIFQNFYRLIWERASFVLGSSEVIITWEIPTSVDSGEYRIRHEGYYQYILGGKYPYKGSTNIFQVQKKCCYFSIFQSGNKKQQLKTCSMND